MPTLRKLSRTTSEPDGTVTNRTVGIVDSLITVRLSRKQLQPLSLIITVNRLLMVELRCSQLLELQIPILLLQLHNIPTLNNSSKPAVVLLHTQMLTATKICQTWMVIRPCTIRRCTSIPLVIRMMYTSSVT